MQDPTLYAFEKDHDRFVSWASHLDKLKKSGMQQ